jgi:hypothetical protein
MVSLIKVIIISSILVEDLSFQSIFIVEVPQVLSFSISLSLSSIYVHVFLNEGL